MAAPFLYTVLFLYTVAHGSSILIHSVATSMDSLHLRMVGRAYMADGTPVSARGGPRVHGSYDTGMCAWCAFTAYVTPASCQPLYLEKSLQTLWAAMPMLVNPRRSMHAAMACMPFPCILPNGTVPAFKNKVYCSECSRSSLPAATSVHIIFVGQKQKNRASPDTCSRASLDTCSRAESHLMLVVEQSLT